MQLYVFALKNFFGMPKHALAVYQTDDSGPHSKPFPGTNVDFRIDYLLHRGFMRAWSGPKLDHTNSRFMGSLRTRLDALDMKSSSWTEIPDFFQFYLKVVSGSMTESVFGSALLNLSPSFLDDLWAYDDALPWMARGIPSFVFSGPYKAREKLLGHLKNWQSHARGRFQESHIKSDGWDPYWGSELVRELEGLLTQRHTHDEDALASHHLGMLFA